MFESLPSPVVEEFSNLVSLFARKTKQMDFGDSFFFLRRERGKNMGSC